MHTLQETKETVLMNLLLANDELTPEELKNGMIFAGVIEPTEENLINFLRANIISLNRRFKKFELQFTQQTGTFGSRVYSVTEEARNFCMSNLLEPIYDEEGNEAGCVFQHPISLNKERMELI